MNRILKMGLLFCTLWAPTYASAAWEGVTDWAQRTALSTATSGVVSKVTVQAGERVKKGKMLLQLEQGALRASLEQARAELNHQKLLREEANKELERAQELYARTLLADHDLDLAKIDFAAADAAYQRSRSVYQQALEALNNSELHAPFDALVVSRLVQPAETVVSALRAEPMLVVAASDKMLARFTVGSEDLASLSLGQVVRVEVSGKRYKAVIDAIMQDEDRMSAEAVFAVEEMIVPGTRVKVSLP